MSDKKRKRIDRERKQRARSLDRLAALQEFEESIAPSLRRALIDRSASAEEILDDHTSYAAARLVTIIATEKDSSKALSAIKDLLDRTKGKAVERVAVAHRFEKMDEASIDALLISRLKEAELPADVPAGELAGQVDNEDDGGEEDDGTEA